VYSPAGAWAELFRKGTGYQGSELLCDETDPQRYITIDRWISKDSYDKFLACHAKEYKSLDKQCETLTSGESLIGKWVTIQPHGKFG